MFSQRFLCKTCYICLPTAKFGLRGQREDQTISNRIRMQQVTRCEKYVLHPKKWQNKYIFPMRTQFLSFFLHHWNLCSKITMFIGSINHPQYNPSPNGILFLALSLWVPYPFPTVPATNTSISLGKKLTDLRSNWVRVADAGVDRLGHGRVAGFVVSKLENNYIIPSGYLT